MTNTSRFRLIKVDKENIERFQEIDLNEGLMRYITGRALTNEEAIHRYSFNLGDKYFGTYFVVNHTDDKIIGFCVIKDEMDEAEIGYLVLEPYKGRGFATEINKALIEICSQNLKNRKISAHADLRNKASIRVLEKSGMRNVRTYKEGAVTVCKFIY